MGVFRDLSGQRFGYLTVIARGPNKGSAARWHCRCDCGKETLSFSNALTSGGSRGCGCGLARVKHGHARGGRGKCSPTYASWKSMMARCTMPSNAGFAHYQKLGITVCEQWRIFANFLADMGERPSMAHTLDRFPNQTGDYEPGNCRWATRREQANNTSWNRLFEFRGEKLTCPEISRRTGLPLELLRHRLVRAGWPVEDAINPQRVQGQRRP